MDLLVREMSMYILAALLVKEAPTANPFPFSAVSSVTGGAA